MVPGSLFVLAFSLSLSARAAESTDLAIVFDTSGSMNDNVAGGRKLDIAKEAMWKFVESLPQGLNVGLVAFDNGCDVKVVEKLARATPQFRDKLKRSVGALRAEGHTPIGDSVKLAMKLLVNSSSKKKRILVMTDGEETCDERGLAEAADAAWMAGIKVYAVGFAFGSQPSRNFRRLGVYKDANDPAQLSTVFTDIRKSLERGDGKYDETKAAAEERPPVSWAGKQGHFKGPGSGHAGKLFRTLELNSSYEHRFTEHDRFTVVEHGYHVLFNEAEFLVDKVEVLRVRLEEKLNFVYGGVEGFVYAADVVVN